MSRKASPEGGASGPNPFVQLSDWHSNACVSNYMQFEELARHYRESADAHVKCTETDQSTLDVHVYAICFLYRHSFELLLKGLLWKSGYALNGDKQLRMTHELQELWGYVKSRGGELLGSDFPLAAKETAEVEQLLANIEAHDPRSDAFRYPFDTTRQRTHPSLTNVNVRALQEAAHRVSELLGSIIDRVDYCYSQRNGGRHAFAVPSVLMRERTCRRTPMPG